MKLSFFDIPLRWLSALLLAVGYMLLQAAAFYPILSFPFPLLLLKSALDAVALAGIGMLLALVLPSSNYVPLDPVQRFINFLALGLIVMLIWVAFFFLSSYLVFGKQALDEIRSLLPLGAFIGAMACVLLVQRILYRMAAGGQEEEEEEEGEREESGEQKEAGGQEEEGEGEGEWEEAREREEAGALERVAVKTGQKIHVILV